MVHGHGDDVVSAQQILASEARPEHSKRKRPYCLLHGSVSFAFSFFFLFLFIICNFRICLMLSKKLQILWMVLTLSAFFLEP